MSKYFGENGLVPVYIELDDGVRLERENLSDFKPRFA